MSSFNTPSLYRREPHARARDRPDQSAAASPPTAAQNRGELASIAAAERESHH
jgi:hypothetical protein